MFCLPSTVDDLANATAAAEQQAHLAGPSMRSLMVQYYSKYNLQQLLPRLEHAVDNCLIDRFKKVFSSVCLSAVQ